MNRVDDLAAIDALQIDRGNPEVRVAELPLDHVQRYALASHLDCVRVPKLMRRETTTHAGSERAAEGSREQPRPTTGDPASDR